MAKLFEGSRLICAIDETSSIKLKQRFWNVVAFCPKFPGVPFLLGVSARALAESVDGETATKVLQKALQSVGQKSSLAVVSDNAACMIRATRDLLKVPRISCVAHLANLISCGLLPQGCLPMRFIVKVSQLISASGRRWIAIWKLVNVSASRYTSCETRWMSRWDALAQVIADRSEFSMIRSLSRGAASSPLARDNLKDMSDMSMWAEAINGECLGRMLAESLSEPILARLEDDDSDDDSDDKVSGDEEAIIDESKEDSPLEDLESDSDDVAGEARLEVG